MIDSTKTDMYLNCAFARRFLSFQKNPQTNNPQKKEFSMEYLLILAAAAAAIVFYLRMQKTETHADNNQVDATYVCDVCGEHECICREDDPKEP